MNNNKRSFSQLNASQAKRLGKKESLQIQKNYQLFYTTAKNSDHLKQPFDQVRNYKKIKYQGIIYKIGNFVELYHLASNSPYVGKLLAIAKIQDIGKNSQLQKFKFDLTCPMIEIEWYLRKSDLTKDLQYDNFQRFLSSNEIFASGQKFALPIEAIMGKCEVLTLAEYFSLRMIENSIYFSRSSYDMELQKFTPAIEKWEPRYCYCEFPYNPDLEWAQCEKCNQWYHSDCVVKDRQDPKQFVCKNCQKIGVLNKKYEQKKEKIKQKKYI